MNKRRFIMVSMLASIDGTIASFFETVTEAIGFGGYLLIALAVEALFVIVYGIKSAFSYEARFKRAAAAANAWLHANKKITQENIKQFTNILKKAPKRVVYFWQQYIMYREGGPAAYLSEENIIEKPLRTSSWLNNVKNLGIATTVWAVFSAVFGFAAQANAIWNFANAITLALLLPLSVALVGGISIVVIKGLRAYNLQDVYENYYVFIRFLTNACDDLPPYIELDLLFTKEELSKASRELKEFYEANARKAKAAFEEAKRGEENTVEYNFKDVGVDGALLLDRAMKESEKYINQKTKVQSQIAQVEAQKDAMRRNFENIQMDLQRKIQASKENIQKLIEQQAATTSRIEVGLLRQQQDKEVKKLDELQRDYDKEETRFKADRDEHDKEIARLREIKDKSLEVAERGMAAEYQSFFEKVMKSAYAVADKRVEKEKKALTKDNETKEQELINVQTQIKRLMDENITLREKLGEYNPEFRQQDEFEGKYDENGNYVYEDGSYHDQQGFFHSADGDVYDMNGEKVSKDYTDEEVDQNERQAIVDEQINQFGSYIEEEAQQAGQPIEEAAEEKVEEPIVEETFETDTATEEPVEPKKTPIIEDFVWEEEESVATEEPAAPAVEENVEPKKTPIIEDFVWDEEEPAAPVVTEEVAPAATEEPVEPKKAPLVEDFVWDEEEPAEEKKDLPIDEDIENFEWADDEEEATPAEEKPEEKVEEVETQVVSEEVPVVEEEKPKTGKKRGRPRKVVAAPVAPARKRGRPRKEEKQAPAAPVAAEKKRGRPRKTEAPAKVEEKKERPKPRKRVVKKEKQAEEKKPVAKASPAKKRGRPRKEKAEPKQPEVAKKRGRPRKDTSSAEVGSIARINQLISEEEEKLSKMKDFLNNEIDQVMTDDKKVVDNEKESLVKEFEDLKTQANGAKQGATSEELVSINKRLEDLIKEINALNNRK